MADQLTSATKCGGHEECKADATIWCSKCVAALCGSCSENFHIKSKYPMVRNHPICRLNERTVVVDCEEHGEPRKLFCLEDQKVICSYCTLFGAHKGHSVEMLKKVAEERRKAHSDNIGKLEAIRVSVDDKIKTYNRLYSSIDPKQQMDELKFQIADRRVKLESKLRKQVDQQHEKEKDTLLKDLKEQFEIILQKELDNLEQIITEKEQSCKKKLELTAENKGTILTSYSQLQKVSSKISEHVKYASDFIKQNDLSLMSTSGMSDKLEATIKEATEEVRKAPTARSFTSSSNWVTNVNEFGIAELKVAQPEAETERRKFMLGTPESVQISGFKFRSKYSIIYDKVGIHNSRPLFQARDRTDAYLWFYCEDGYWRVSSKSDMGTNVCWVHGVATNLEHPIQLGTSGTWNEIDEKHEWRECEVCVEYVPSNS